MSGSKSEAPRAPKLSKREREKRDALLQEVLKLRDQVDDLREQKSKVEMSVPTLPDITGRHFRHVKYGDGQVKSCDKGYAVLSFASGEKKFKYPYSFTLGVFCLDDELLKTTCQQYETIRNQAESLNVQVDEIERRIGEIETALQD
ncbi:hypothetical protein ACTNEN_07590 [Oribacterium sp. HCP28S3_H8]|uniref:hypothetical protein n=1 Tax=Oribacterium sp. HCP28S3_H8 TaxID=3438945 RepID=UPI003F8C35A2